MGKRANGIEKATGVAWSEWTAWLTEQGAHDREHADIARLAERRLGELGITRHAVTGAAFNTEWWAQGIAIDFEQDHGMRATGQTSEGGFAVTASRTRPGSVDDAFDAWLALMAGRTEFEGVELADEPSVSRTEKWRYWRAGLADGSRVSVDISARKVTAGAPAKAVVAVNHSGLASADAGTPWRAHWKALLADLA